MQSRQTILPKRLVAPGPNASQLDMILAAAATAPDHGQLLPWRFIVVPQHARGLLAEEFVKALCDRDPSALPEQVAQAREKAYRAPVLMLAVVNAACGDPDVDLNERVMSAGCAVQNMLLMAESFGLSALWGSPAKGTNDAVTNLCSMDPTDHVLGIIYVGWPTQPVSLVERPPVNVTYL